MTKKNGFKDTISHLFIGNAVPIMFIILIAIAIPLSGFSTRYLIEEMVTRLGRDSFLVLSLLIPIMAGMGLNFGIVLGAMAGQIGIILVTNWGVSGVGGLFLAMAVATPLAILLGWIAGIVLNHAKGREMVTSMILGFFINGVYQLVVLYFMGKIIPISNSALVLSRGYGIRNAIDLKGMRQSLDRLIPLKIGGIAVPVATFIFIALLCVFIWWFAKTKLGHDMRAVGQDMSVSENAGIKVERTRIIAIILSTVLACYGQIIFLQNIGTLNTYNSHDQTATFAIAALLIGGATVAKASIPNVFVGVILFHLMFVVAPKAGKQLMGSAMIGEYFRVFVSYGIIAVSIVLYAWKRSNEKERSRRSLRGEQEIPKTD
ncbi:ABC transporter permease [bacterium]|nr:ABC transporter permease [bacterium]